MLFREYSFREYGTSNTSRVVKRVIIIAVIVALAIGGFFLYRHFKESGNVFGYYRVSRVVDGDTIEIDKDGKTVRIRLIGVDTPEVVDPDEPEECYGKEASEYTKKELFDKFVKIETDPSQDLYDTHNRLLAYIFTDSTNFNKGLIENGYAYEFTYDKPYKYQKEFKEAEEKAKNDEAGLWSPTACPDKTEKTSSGTSQSTQKNNTQNCKIKGNISYNTGEKIYHVPGQKYYEDTVIDERSGERWFCSEAEARAAGWRRSKE